MPGRGAEAARRGRAGAGQLAVGEALRPPGGGAAGRRKAEPAAEGGGRRTGRVGGVATPASEDGDDRTGARGDSRRASIAALGSGTGVLCLGPIQTILYVLEAQSIDMVRSWSWRRESFVLAVSLLHQDDGTSEMLDKNRGKREICFLLMVVRFLRDVL